MQVKTIIKKKNYPRTIRSYFVGTMVIIVVAAVYGVMQFTKLAEIQDAMAAEQEQMGTLTLKADKLAATYKTIQSSYETEFSKTNNAIQDIFPTEDDYTNLTIKLEKIINDMNLASNPIVMNNLSFGRARTDTGSDYSVLPFQTTISTTQDNFDKFLRYVNSSGDLATGSRLMDIRSISINFSQNLNAAAGGEMLDVNLNMNAYLQNNTK